MLTLFAIPKGFRGEFNQIQRNAIASWTLLEPKPEIILLGDDEGTAEVAKEFGVKHVSGVERNEHGTPLVSSLFEIAQRVGDGSLFAYVNADIILLDDFMKTIQQIPFQKFMLTGQRWNLDFNEAIAPNPGWTEQLRHRAMTLGALEGPQAMDYFVFTRNTYTHIPPFAIGRPCWDNWMLYSALNLNIPLIDATEAIVAVHQNHDYNHHPDGKKGYFGRGSPPEFAAIRRQALYLLHVRFGGLADHSSRIAETFVELATSRSKARYALFSTSKIQIGIQNSAESSTLWGSIEYGSPKTVGNSC